MLKKIYSWFHRLTSNYQERDEYSAGYWQDKIRKETLILCRNLKGRFLEVGFGEGLFLSQLAKQNPGSEIWGIDNCSKELNRAGQRIKEANLVNINLSLQDASNLSFADEYFDTVVCINMFFNLESLKSIKQALVQMKRVCKKSGKLIFEFRNSLNPLLLVKYRLARYYDATVKDLPLRCYRLKQIESMLGDLDFKNIRKIFLCYFIFKRFAPVILIEAEKR